MGCENMYDAEGNWLGVVCSRGRRTPSCSTSGCSGRSAFQCDFPLKGSKTGKTCSRHMCSSCRVSVGKGIDYCRTHAVQPTLPGAT